MRRVLVVANRTLSEEQLQQRLVNYMADEPCSFYILVPVPPRRSSHRGDRKPCESRAAVGRRLFGILSFLYDMGAEATGKVSDQTPLRAIADLLFDEPLSNVDLGGEDLILETLNRIEKAFGITVLLVSHDVHNVIQYSDSALALNRTVVYFGPSKSLSDPALLARIYGSGTLLSKHAH